MPAALLALTLLLAVPPARAVGIGIGIDAALPAPPFERYPVAPAFHGRPAAPDLASDRKARLFRTRLREGAADGPNFADHYTVVTWGCGSGCQSHAIVDARGGRVVVLPFTTGEGVAFRRDSRLFVADPAERCLDPIRVGPEASTWFRWDGRRLVRLGAYRILAPCDVPPVSERRRLSR